MKPRRVPFWLVLVLVLAVGFLAGLRATDPPARAEDDAPLCVAEPNPDMAEQVEIIRYAHAWQYDPRALGVTVQCPR